MEKITFGSYTKAISEFVLIANTYFDKNDKCYNEELEYAVMKNKKYWEKINSDMIEKYEDEKRKINYKFAEKNKDGILLKDDKGRLQYTEENELIWHDEMKVLNEKINSEEVKPKIYKMIGSAISNLRKFDIEHLKELGFVE